MCFLEGTKTSFRPCKSVEQLWKWSPALVYISLKTLSGVTTFLSWLRHQHQRFHFFRRLQYEELVSSVLNLFCRFVGKECPEDGRENASAEGLPITTDIYASRYRKRASSILKDPTHQAHAVFVPLRQEATEYQEQNHHAFRLLLCLLLLANRNKDTNCAFAISSIPLKNDYSFSMTL